MCVLEYFVKTATNKQKHVHYILTVVVQIQCYANQLRTVHNAEMTISYLVVQHTILPGTPVTITVVCSLRYTNTVRVMPCLDADWSSDRPLTNQRLRRVLFSVVR
jgi:hypothetical protein